MPINAQRAQAIFASAIELTDPVARAALLDRECASETELRQRVDELLAAHDDSAGLPPADVQATGPFRGQIAPELKAGSTFAGRYKIREKLGEGGMGTVYVADQIEPVSRRVALKIIKTDVASERLLARFDQERQALALMDHPNIAKVLDAGITDRTPYFVMELIKGVPITKYCDGAKLSPKQRLELFIPVCQAVQHAHQKGIIHRDLKPSNILIGLYDGRPVPKVIDFGVAKATGPRLTDQSIYTEIGAIMGTLEYMSPEQAELNNLDIDTRSDIYSLGVLLYELLTGDVPLSRKDLKSAGFVEMLRLIKEVEPPKPSTRLSNSGSLPSIAASRHMEPKKLTALVRIDLDWIVMKALEKDRSRRYETANGFAMDIQRYLANEPVLASPPSVGYRVRKFVRRNKAQVMAAGLVLFTLLSGIVGTTFGLVRAESRRVEAEEARVAERDRAEGERQATQRALADRDAKGKALIAETAARAAEKQARDQALAALRAMTDDIIENQMARGTTLTEENKEFLRKIIKQYDGFAAITGDDVESRSIRAEGYARVGIMRSRLGEMKEAEEAQTTALDLRERLVAESPSRPEFRHDLAGSYNNLGLLLRTTGRLKDAEIAFVAALALDKQLAADFPTRPEFRRDLATNHNNLGNLLRATGRLTEAEEAFVAALALKKQLVADFPNQPEFRRELARSHHNLGVLLRDTGQPKQAERAYSAALNHFKELVADFPTRPEFRQDLAASYNNLGALLYTSGHPKEAEKAYTAALGLYKQLAADFPTRTEFRQGLAGTHNNLGLLLRATGQMKDAEEAFVAALALRKQLAADFPSRPDFRQDLAGSHNNLGLLLRATGRLKEAEAAFAAALALKKQLAADFPTRPEFRKDLANSHYNLGLLLHATGRLKEAEETFAASRALYKQLANDFPNQPDLRNYLAVTLVYLADLRNQQRDFAAGKAYLDEALPHHQAALKANPRNSTYRRDYQKNLYTLARANAGLLSQANVVRAAEKIRDQGWNPPTNAYDAACALALCVPIAEKHDELDSAKRRAAMKYYADLAMDMLRDAVKKGYRDAAHMKKDKDLDPLRDREDFKKLLAELEAEKKK